MKRLINIAILSLVCLGPAITVPAQMPVPPPMPAYQPLADVQLDQLLGPIALYSDPLIAEILTASTSPAQIVIADRFLSDGGDPGLIDQQSWDVSVQSLARYPELLKWLDDNLNWTTELGQAFLNQQQDVMNAIQRLRQSAWNYGNLRSTPQQQVINEDGYIEILPVDPDTVYVPVYQPDQVYYQTANGAPFITFGAGWPVGGWLNCDFDWGNHHIIVWNRDHPRPRDWWHEPRRERHPESAPVWRQADRWGADRQDQGDRGWGAPAREDQERNAPRRQPVVAVIGHSMSGSSTPRRTPTPAAHRSTPAAERAPAPAQHFAPVSNGAFIGIQNSQDAKNYSDRGWHSLQPAAHAAPVSRPASPAGHGGHNSGGDHATGGGGHNSNSHR